ncbi:carboxypeptidase-like regulatory domain-containing protein [Candidatus Thioglobus sp.]|uniref:carboxypeptidase-like regulatory domain-containing protein n=1 Tax=Candidatus Thioglobus sp. TaxID=2026721 RepID=UPI003D116796
MIFDSDRSVWRFSNEYKEINNQTLSKSEVSFSFSKDLDKDWHISPSFSLINNQSENQIEIDTVLEKNWGEGNLINIGTYYTHNLSTEPDTFGLNIANYFSLNKNWQLDFSANYNNIEDDDSNSYELTLNHFYSQGRPYQTLGGGKARGSGSISGLVFFDENDDGIKQASEKVAKNQTLVFDNFYNVKTDNQGRYRFSLIKPGPHSLFLDESTLDLPWESLDSVKTFELSARGAQVIDFRLTKIR